jgi:Asp-tRNA(Asn)/Glu-tRNA(Gln) amidotransferase A subunit family amidase
MTSRNLVRATAVEVAAWLRSRELRAVDVLEAVLERIAAREPAIHAWAFLDPERARHQAQALDAGPVRGPLHGLPIGVKDLMDTADMPTAYGSPIYAGHRPAWDAAAVASARAAGAIVVGKTVTTEFATFTPAATVNPHDFEHTPGGSSSGSAAAVADGMVPLAFGTQTVGSIIRPASFCGVVGYKPTFGTLSRAGVKLLSESLDTVGAIARTVDDAALMVGALSGRGELVDLAKIERPWIGLCRTHDWRETQPEVGTAMEAAARGLSAAGARVIQVDLPADFASLGDAHGDILGYEIARNLGFEHAHHNGRLSSRLRELLDAGAQVSAERYDRARELAHLARAALPGVFDACHVLLAPSTTGEAPVGLESTGNPVMNRVWTLLHVPCVTVPVATGPNGLPVGLQVIGRIGDDARTLAAARWIHERMGAG